MSDFGQRLRQARKMRSFTQKDLAKKLGVAQSTIANYETNERFPGETALKEISDCLKISIDFLLGLSDQANKTSEVFIGKVALPNQEDFADEIDQLYQLLLQKQEHQAIALTIALAKQHSPLFLMQTLFEPIMRLVGEQWQQGQVDISTEHYISGVIESLISITSHENFKRPSKGFKVAFVVPGAEEHVLTLKMAREHFRQSGWQVFYLGRSMPVLDFHKLVLEQKIDLVVMSITLTHHLNSAEYFIQALRMLPTKHPFSILVSGQAIESSKEALNLLKPDYYVPTLNALEQLIPEIESHLTQQRASG